MIIYSHKWHLPNNKIQNYCCLQCNIHISNTLSIKNHVLSLYSISQLQPQVSYQRVNYIQITMKTIKNVLSFVVNISEFILQQRISPSKSALQNIISLKCQLNLLEHQQNPSEDICHMLIHKQFYQIRNKLMSKPQQNCFENTVITLKFTLSDELTSVPQTAQIWRITVLQKKQKKSKQQMIHQKIHAIKQILNQLTSQFIFSDLLLNREITKKYIIDFHLDMTKNKDCQTSLLLQTYNMWSATASLDSNHQINIDCYWKNKIDLSVFKKPPASNGMAKTVKNKSQDTCGDSSEINLTALGQKKLRSFSTQLSLFQVYDSELEVTVLSNDGDSLSSSHNVIREVTLGEDDQFQLLIEQNQDDIFLKQNDGLFRQWDILACANFN